MPRHVSLHIKYEVRDLVRTMDFYNILLGDLPADIYEGHAMYTIIRQMLTITFIENPETVQPASGNFNLIFNSGTDLHERFTQFSRKGFPNTPKADHQSIGRGSHSFSIQDPNGICWQISIKDKKTSALKFFNFPRVNSMWDILKPL